MGAGSLGGDLDRRGPWNTARGLWVLPTTGPAGVGETTPRVSAAPLFYIPPTDFRDWALSWCQCDWLELRGCPLWGQPRLVRVVGTVGRHVIVLEAEGVPWDGQCSSCECLTI